MANTKSARKAAKQSVHRRAHNVGQRSELRTAIKNARKAIEAGDNMDFAAYLQHFNNH